MAIKLENGDDWVFFNKGNANLIYKYTGALPQLKNLVLRLRLSDQEFDTKEVYDFMTLQMKPLLQDFAIDAELVEVRFRKDGALNDGFGLLLPNLLAGEYEVLKSERYFKLYKSTNSYVLEMKPKWLKLNDYGCRNCANHRYKHNEEEPKFCSTTLLNDSKLESLECAINSITSDPTVHTALLEYFQRPSNAFRRLHALQDYETPLETIDSHSQITEKVCLQMTLRDVTVFIKIKDSQVISTTITDIDPKSPTKWEKWVTTEQKLIKGGYYKSH